MPPVAVLRDADGKLMMTLEKADITRLIATGWKPPTPITVKARDGETDLYGLMFKPTKLDPTEEVSDRQPHLSRARRPAASAAARSRPRAATRRRSPSSASSSSQIDGMGTPWRSKKFHEAYFGDMGDNTLPDQVAGMKQLAREVSVDRHRPRRASTATPAAATRRRGAMFRYPDFFKVGISEAGNHDNRVYEDDWAEKWPGLLEKKPDGTTQLRQPGEPDAGART